MNSGDYINKYLFSGKEQDKESDLQYFEAIYYDNELGRFESIDRVFWEVGETERGILTMFDPQKLNGYSYTKNNPLIYTDPSGEEITLLGILGSIIGLEYCGDSGTAQKYQDQEDSFVPATILTLGTIGLVNSVRSGTEKIVEKEIQNIVKKGVKAFEKVATKSSKNINFNKLEYHFEKHGSEFGATNTSDYAQKALNFLNKKIDKDMVQWIRKSDGSTIRVNKSSGYIGIAKKGQISTFFKADDMKKLDGWIKNNK